MNSILSLCKKISLKLASESVDEFEVYGDSSINNEIEIFNGNVENLSFSDTRGIGIRVFKNNRMGYSYSSNLTEEALDDCIKKAIENSNFTAEDEYNSLPRNIEFLYPDSTIDRKRLFSENLRSYNTENKISLAKNLESIALKSDKRIKSVNNLIYEDSISEVALVNSLGFIDSYSYTSAFIYLSVIAREKEDVSTGDYFGYTREPGSLDIEDIAKNAVKRSVGLLGAKKIKSQVLDLVLDPFVADQFLGVIAGILAADEVQKGKSLFKDKIGTKVFTKNITITDDGTLIDGLASRPFDGEGVPKGKTLVFDEGVLMTYLYDVSSARKDKKLTTGNAVRASYKSPHQIGVSNFYIRPSEQEAGKIFENVDRGFFVTDIIGLHSGTNPISGQLSVGAKGFLIKNGSLDAPVKEVTIATDILSFCKNLDKIGKDLKFLPAGGYIGSPSLLIKEISVSGD